MAGLWRLGYIRVTCDARVLTQIKHASMGLGPWAVDELCVSKPHIELGFNQSQRVTRDLEFHALTLHGWRFESL
jgi:hypothetical protein